MNRLKLLAIAAGLAFCFAAVTVEAQGVWGACGEGNQSSPICADTTDGEDIVKRIVDIFLFVIGVLSVIMIIHSGVKYITSRGDPAAIKSAKDTLLYSVIGLIVAILAFAIVNFVIGAFGAGDDEDTGNIGSALAYLRTDR